MWYMSTGHVDASYVKPLPRVGLGITLGFDRTLCSFPIHLLHLTLLDKALLHVFNMCEYVT